MLGAQLIHGCLNSVYIVLVTVHLYMLCLVTQSYPALCDPMDCGLPGSSVSRRGYWKGLPCPPPGDLPNPGIEPRYPTLQADSFPAEP